MLYQWEIFPSTCCVCNDTFINFELRERTIVIVQPFFDSLFGLMSFVFGEHTNLFHVKLVGVICVHAHTHLLICNTHVQLTTLFFLSPWTFMRYNRHCVCSLCSILYCFHFLFFGSYYDQNEN